MELFVDRGLSTATSLLIGVRGLDWSSSNYEAFEVAVDDRNWLVRPADQDETINLVFVPNLQPMVRYTIMVQAQIDGTWQLLNPLTVVTQPNRQELGIQRQENYRFEGSHQGGPQKQPEREQLRMEGSHGLNYRK